MKIFLIILALPALLLASSLRSSTSTSLEVLSSIPKIKETDFGKKLLSFVQIHLSSEGKPEDILDLLNQMKAVIEQEDAQADAEKAEKEIVWAASLKQLNEDISKYEALIGQLQIDISDNERDKEITIELISEKEDSLDKALTNFDNLESSFAETTEVFEEKIESSRKLKSILGNILQICLDKMEGATPSFIEIKKNPEFKKYFSLVQIFLQFNPETMAKLIEKLNAIIAGITESINTDETYIANLRTKYETIMGNLRSTIVLLTEELDVLYLHKEDLIQKLTIEYQDLASDESILKQNKEQKAELEVLMERYLLKYIEDKKSRAEAVELIMKAIPIIQDKIIGKA